MAPCPRPQSSCGPPSSARSGTGSSSSPGRPSHPLAAQTAVREGGRVVAKGLWRVSRRPHETTSKKRFGGGGGAGLSTPSLSISILLKRSEPMVQRKSDIHNGSRTQIPALVFPPANRSLPSQSDVTGMNPPGWRRVAAGESASDPMFPLVRLALWSGPSLGPRALLPSPRQGGGRGGEDSLRFLQDLAARQQHHTQQPLGR